MQVPRYKLVVDRLAAQLRGGRWPAGTRLATHRELARREGIAVATASRVYADLEAMGLVSSEQGRGTFVREQTLADGHGVDQVEVAADVVDLAFNYPVLAGQADLMRAALRGLAAEGDLASLLHYGTHRGRRQDREAVAKHLRGNGLPAAGADRVLITNGAQHALAVTAMALLRAGDVVAVDALTYPGFVVLAEHLGLDLAPVPVTDHGPDLAALDRLCATRPVTALYAMPTLHNPLGWVLDEPARRHLVDLARRHDLTVIEDTSYAYLAADAPPPLAATAPERTVHVAGLSKNVAPGLRVGYLLAPPAHLPALERAIRATTWNAPTLLTTLACRWLADGTVTALEQDKRADAAARQLIARGALTGLAYQAHSSSYFGWLTLPEGARADRIAADLATHRISVATATPYATTTHAPQALRVALGSVSHHELRDALLTVARTIRDDAAV